jgi:hypothetical protein
MTGTRYTVTAIALALAAPWTAAAQQNQSSMQTGAQGSADIEMGAVHPSQVEMGAGASGGSRMHTTQPPASHDSDGVRIALQARLDALNMLGFSEPAVAGNPTGPDVVGRRLFVPMIAPGVRLIDTKLFLGLGLGLSGASAHPNNNNNNKVSRSGWSLSPIVSYDVLSDQMGALSLVGMLNMARLSETETCANICVNNNDARFGWGLTLGAGLRGFLTKALALGGELGWGFLTISPGNNNSDTFVHGIVGNIFLEASVGL